MPLSERFRREKPHLSAVIDTLLTREAEESRELPASNDPSNHLKQRNEKSRRATNSTAQS